ncbi:MazG family protein [Cellulomonas soli]|uniref:MazG family protein n=1 Tax=Cellulomonas soli TaxID=931535 RepID=UPI003F86E8BC
MSGSVAPGGSPDALRTLVAVMDRLRSPGGCPWDAEQTHRSLVPYLLEEAHELAEAIELGDRADLREELGDVLLQVVFHARVAQEDPGDPFDLDDVAADLTAKLVRRHPHVFGPGTPAAPTDGAGAGDRPATGDLHVQWDRLKKAEKQRASALDGVPASLGALARAQKLVSRAGRAGLPVEEPHDAAGASDTTAIGERLLALVLQAQADGVDAEGELRRATGRWEARVRAVEQQQSAPPAGTDA